jgi:diacylglycerol O-acyltransferase / wax synthase
VLSQRLSRDRPLWELWLLDGLAADRWALIFKIHHAMMDGAGLVRYISALLDREPAADRPAPAAWHPAPEPPPLTLLAEAIGGGASAVYGAARGLAGAIAAPRRALARVRATMNGFGELAAMGRQPGPESPLNAASGAQREVEWIALDRGDLKTTGRRHDATVNDVVVAIIAGAIRRWCTQREIELERRSLRAMVPVMLRDARHDSGNSLAMLAIALPVHAAEPGERLALTASATRAAKNSNQSVATGAMLRLQDLIPERVLPRAGRVLWEARDMHLTVTSMPGDLDTLYFDGRRALDVTVVGFLTPGLTLTFAVVTYGDTLTVSLIGDPELLTDLDRIAGAFRDEAELLGVGVRRLAVEPVAESGALL